MICASGENGGRDVVQLAGVDSRAKVTVPKKGYWVQSAGSNALSAVAVLAAMDKVWLHRTSISGISVGNYSQKTLAWLQQFAEKGYYSLESGQKRRGETQIKFAISSRRFENYKLSLNSKDTQK